MIERLGQKPQVIPQALGHPTGIGEALAERTEVGAVEGMDSVAQITFLGPRGLGIVQFVGSTVLMHDPCNVARMLHAPTGKLQADHGIDAEIGFRPKVQRLRSLHARQDRRRGPVAKRHSQGFGLVAGFLKCAHQTLRVGLGTPAGKRQMIGDHEQFHCAAAAPCSADSAAVPGSPPVASPLSPTAFTPTTAKSVGPQKAPFQRSVRMPRPDTRASCG